MQHVLRFIEPAPLNFVSASGCWLLTDSGDSYLDLESGTWSSALGHNHPRINQAICDQLQQIMHVGTRYPNQMVEAAAQALLELCDFPQGKCMFLCSGSEAVEFMVQAARRISSAPLQLRLSGSYLAAYGSAAHSEDQTWLTFDWQACQSCNNSTQCALDCPHLEALPLDQIGSFVFEPGSFSGQVKFPPRKLTQFLARQVQSRGGWLAVNEITTGMGRTGKWFGYQHDELQPDLIAVGKGLGNGYPVSAVVLHPRTADALQSSGWSYAQSHQNDPLGAAVAQTVIQVMREEGWLESCQVRGAELLRMLQDLSQRYPLLEDVRGRGLLIAIELRDEMAAAGLFQHLLDQHFLSGYKSGSRVLRFFPPFSISSQEIQLLQAALEDFFKRTYEILSN